MQEQDRPQLERYLEALQNLQILVYCQSLAHHEVGFRQAEKEAAPWLHHGAKEHQDEAGSEPTGNANAAHIPVPFHSMTEALKRKVAEKLALEAAMRAMLCVDSNPDSLRG